MRNATCFRVLTAGLSIATLAVVNGASVRAQTVTAIEQDWQLQIDTPNAGKTSPQVNCLTATGADPQSLRALFLVNELGPDGGNLQLQLWDGDQLLTSMDVSNSGAALNTIGEKVNWTTRLSLSKGVLTAEVYNLASDTWGTSTGKTRIASISTNTSLNDLNNYDPNVTCTSSGVEFGNARVQKLILRKSRIYTGNQKSVETSLDRVIFQNN
jgi:hypothetical protein